MSTNIFEKILKIVQIVVTILQFALKSIYGDDVEKDDKE